MCEQSKSSAALLWKLNPVCCKWDTAQVQVIQINIIIIISTLKGGLSSSMLEGYGVSGTKMKTFRKLFKKTRIFYPFAFGKFE